MKAILVLIILFSITESNVIYSQKKQKNKQENIKADTTGHQQKNETKNESNKSSDNNAGMFWLVVIGGFLFIVFLVTVIAFKRASKFRKKFYKKE